MQVVVGTSVLISAVFVEGKPKIIPLITVSGYCGIEMIQSAVFVEEYSGID